MTDTNTITLPRSVLEQALDALLSTDAEEGTEAYERELEAVKALRAALEQPPVEQEPVAWAEEIIEFLHAHYDTEMIKELDSGDELIRLDDAIAAVEEVAQRYTRPQQPPRQPLTDEQIEQIRWGCPWLRLSTSDEIVTCTKRQLDNFARAIERAHGIGGDA